MKRRWRLWRVALFDRAMDVVAYPVWLAGPRATAQQRAFRCAKLIGPCLEALLRRRRPGSFPISTILMNRFITRMSRYENGFPLDVEVHNSHLVDAALSEGRGVLIATVHTFMALAAHGALHRDGQPPLFVVRARRNMVGWNWGHPAPFESVDFRHPSLFTKLGAALKDNRTVISFVDYEDELPQNKQSVLISPNLFAWAHARRVPMLYMFVHLDETGKIHLELEEAPAREQTFDATLPAFMDFLNRQSRLRYVVQRAKALRQPQGA